MTLSEQLSIDDQFERAATSIALNTAARDQHRPSRLAGPPSRRRRHHRSGRRVLHGLIRKLS